MFGHRSFLLLDSDGSADIMSLIKGGYELSNCHFAFEQGIDDKGKATTRVHGGTIYLSLSMLPPDDIIDWGTKARKYVDGVIVVLDAENIPIEKIIFKNAACVDIDIEYTHQGDSYSCTKIVVQSEILIVGNGIDFDNEWTQ